MPLLLPRIAACRCTSALCLRIVRRDLDHYNVPLDQLPGVGLAHGQHRERRDGRAFSPPCLGRERTHGQHCTDGG